MKRGRPLGTKEKWNTDKRRDVEDRFWEKVDRTAGPDGCWEWKANIVYGYGYFYISKGKYTGAHQWSWSYFNGPIPENMYVCHTCDNRKCVNPKHLFLGTAKDNAQDRQNKGRSVLPLCQGAAHGMSKLNDEIVLEISRMCSNGVSDSEIAKKYGIVRQTVNKIRNKYSWKHLWNNGSS